MQGRTRIMWIEQKSGGLVGPARIGRVSFSKSGASLRYGDRTFQSLKGQGFKANYFDTATGDPYWISGCHQDGADALYSTNVEIDADVLDEYWVNIRHRPDMKHVSRFRAPGKY